MLTRLTSFVRTRWHPLWRLRQLSAFRRFQRRWDWSVYTRIPETDIRVAVKLLRDASWIFSPANVEPEIRMAFALVLDLLKPATFWDIGANIGFYSWFVRRRPSVRQIVMFEPDPTNFALITRTITKNAISDCQAMNVALADQPGEASFLVDRASGATGSLEATSHRENEQSLQHAYQMSETITCRTATIDELIAEGFPQPSLIKIDVEGAEHLVLAGAKSCLARHRPIIIIETSNTDLVRGLLATGYSAFRIDHGNLLFVAATDSDLTSLHRAFPKYDQVA
jgi:FkbM family methyltransferase